MQTGVRLASLLCLSNCIFHDLASAQPGTAADGLRVSSDFPGGSAKVLAIDSTNGIIRITPAGDPDRGWPCWWYLRIDGAKTDRPLTLEVVANESIVRLGEAGQTRPLQVVWQFPDRAAFSTDGRNWMQSAPGQRQGKKFVYRITAASPTIWVAWGPPFTLRDAEDLIQRATKLYPDAKPFELARTREGRPVPGLRVSPPDARFGVWIQARQHAWECGSSWVCCGLAEWFVSTDPLAVSLRTNAEVTIVPIIDVDSVETGNGGKGAKPCDQDEDYGPNAFYPEVRAVMEQISARAKAGRFDVCLDLHNPGAGARDVSIYIPPVALLDRIRLDNQNAFTNLLRRQVSAPIPFLGRLGPLGMTYDPAVDRSIDAWAGHEGGSHVVSLTVETAWNTPSSTTSGYRRIGAQIGRCIELYRRAMPHHHAGL